MQCCWGDEFLNGCIAYVRHRPIHRNRRKLNKVEQGDGQHRPRVKAKVKRHRKKNEGPDAVLAYVNRK